MLWSIVLIVFLLNANFTTLVYGADVVGKEIEKSKTINELEKTEKIVQHVAKKLETKVKDPEIKKQLVEKQVEIKKVIEEAKKEIKQVDNVKEIEKKKEEVKKRVVLKLIDGITPKEDVKDNVEEVVKTPTEYLQALKVMKEMFDKWTDYSLIVKTKYSYGKFVGLLKKFDKNIKPKKLFEWEKGYTYYEVTIPKESVFAQEMLKDIEHFKMPKSFLWIKIVEPRIYKVENTQEVEWLDKTWWVAKYGIKDYIKNLKEVKKVKVAVIDTGLDPKHEDLKANVWKWYDFIEFDNQPQDENWHGTHVAVVDLL